MYVLVFYVTRSCKTCDVLILYVPMLCAEVMCDCYLPMLYVSNVEMHVMESKVYEQTPYFQEPSLYQVATE